MTGIVLPAYQDYTRRAQVATGYAVGSEAAQKVGDFYVKQKTGPGDLGAAGFSLASSTTVKDVAFNSQSGVLSITLHDTFFSAKSILLVPTVTGGKVEWLCTSEGIDNSYLPQACRVTQDAANAQLAATQKNSQSKNKAKSDYDQALVTIEAQHPELNPDSPSYNQAAMDWVAERKKMYDQGGGRSGAISLQQAVTDYAAALQRNQASQPNVPTQSTPPQAATHFPRAIGPNAIGRPQYRSSTKNCVYDSVMTDEDYRACGLNPPQNVTIQPSAKGRLRHVAL